MLPSLSNSQYDEKEILKSWISEYEPSEKISLRLYDNLGHAGTEIIKGLSGLFPHKKRALIIGGGHSFIESATAYLSSEAFDLEIISWQEWNQKKEELLKIDFCFALLAEDHFLTGEIFPYKEFLTEWNKARKFSISISSRSHFYDKEILQEKEGFRARVLAMGNHCYVNALGSRMRKLPDLILGNKYLNLDCLMEARSWKNLIIESASQDTNLNHPRIEFLKEDTGMRLPDRIVLRLKAVDAYSLKELMLEEWGGEYDEQISTGSLCEWGGIRLLEWMGLENHQEIIVISKPLFELKKAEIIPLLDKILKMMGEPI